MTNSLTNVINCDDCNVVQEPLHTRHESPPQARARATRAGWAHYRVGGTRIRDRCPHCNGTTIIDE